MTLATRRGWNAPRNACSPTLGSGAYLLDAISEVSNGLRAREDARKVIVVITSEGPEFSTRYHTNVLDALRDADVTLHSFVLTRRRAGICQ